MDSKQRGQSEPETRRAPAMLRRSCRQRYQATDRPRPAPRHRRNHSKHSEGKKRPQPSWATDGEQQRMQRQQRRRNANIITIHEVLQDQTRAKHSVPYTLSSFTEPALAITPAGAQPHVKVSLCVGDSLHAAWLLGAERADPSGAVGTAVQAGCRVGVLNMAPADGGMRTSGGYELEDGEGSGRREMTDHQSLMERTTLYHGLKHLDEWDFRQPENYTVQENVLVFADSEDNFGLGDNTNKPKLLPVDGRFYIDVVTAAMFRTQRLEVFNAGLGVVSGFIWRNGIKDTIFFGSESGDDLDSGVSGHSTVVFPTYKDYWEALTVRMRTVLRLFRRQGINKIVLGTWGVDGLGHHMSDIVDAWKFVILGEVPPNYSKVGFKADQIPVAEGWDGLEVVFATNNKEMADDFQRWYVSKIEYLG